MRQQGSVEFGTVVVLFVALAFVSQPVIGQERADDNWTVPRTVDGQADLQGVWSNNGTTPLERPEIFGGRAVLTDEEMAEIRQRADELLNDEAEQAGDVFGDFLFRQAVDDPSLQLFDTETGNYNPFWLVDRSFDNRTSLIIDPPNGRIPPVTEEVLSRRRGARPLGGSAAGPENTGLTVRCITYGVPDLMSGYNSYFQILQTPTHVVILQELIHDARVIPLDGRPHVDEHTRQWNGDSRGHWEGDTLVVETKNYSPNTGFTMVWGDVSENLRVVERFTRENADTIQYKVTFHDETTWTSPWTALIFLQKSDDAIFEYACHEGNYAMEGILGGARLEEAAAAEAAPDAR